MVVLAYLICAFVWGTTWFAIRRSIGEDGFPTIESAALRFSIAAAILGAIWLLGLSRPTPRDRRQYAWLGLAGLFNAAGYALVYRAEEDISGALAAVLFGTFPLATAVLATITRTEKVARSQVLGALVALGGIVIIFADRLAVSVEQALGIAMMLCAVFCSASYGVILKRKASDVNPLASTAVFLTVTALVLWLVAPLSAPLEMPWPPPTEATLALLYLAIFGSVLTFASYLYLLKRVSLMASTTLVFVQPMIAIGLDALLEKTVILGPTTYIGMFIVLLGVFVSLAARELARRRRARETKLATATAKSDTTVRT